ncbi:hypothetical protein, partial [Enterococcus faecalis]|uniref:hypothetical protein n=1 Tax=Enterococcus faecalis TaxID=1351 RepID=UPI001AD64967
RGFFFGGGGPVPKSPWVFVPGLKIENAGKQKQILHSKEKGADVEMTSASFKFQKNQLLFY